MVFKGATKLHDAVAASMGPSGRDMYYEHNENAFLSKDGATIAKWIMQSRLIDPFERAGAAILRRPSMKSEEEAGDGTTAATILCYSMMEKALKHVEGGANVIGIARGMRQAYAEIEKFLPTISRQATTRADWKKVAYISSRDMEVAEMIAQAMEAVGKDGYIKVEKGDDWQDHDLKLEVRQGMTFPRGYATETAINDRAALKCILRDVPILVTDLSLFTERDAQNLAGIAQALYKQGMKKLVIIAKKFDGIVTDFILANNIPYHQKNAAVSGDGMLIVPVEAPGFGSVFTEEFCDDLAVLTGATFYSDTRGNSLEAVPLNDTILDALGRCQIFEASKKQTNIVNEGANKEAVEQRIAEIRVLQEKSEGELDRERFKQRLAALTKGMAIITVGGYHSENIQEKKARVDDAVLAAKCANEEGIVPGAGMAIMYARRMLLKGPEANGSGEAIGYEIVRSALSAPLRQIAKNCCIDMDKAEEASNQLQAEKSFDMSKGELDVVDAFDVGIVDPLKVVRSALLNAIEGALTFITTETFGVSVPEDKQGKPLWEVIRGDAADSRVKAE